MDDTAKRICLPRLPAFKESTFCADQADTNTVEYIRADLHQKALDRIEELEAENAELKAEVGRLREASLSVMDRWDTPGHVINRLRAALARTSTTKEGEE